MDTTATEITVIDGIFKLWGESTPAIEQMEKGTLIDTLT